MSSALVGVVLGSRADFTAIRRGLETLRVMGVPYEFEIASPERTPEKVVQWARDAAARGMEILIAASGASASLAAVVAANTSLPVIGVPLDGTPRHGEETLLSMVQLGSGAPVACVGVNAAENAAILAVRILALKHAHYARVLMHQNQNATIRQETGLQELRHQYPDLVDPKVTAPGDNRLFVTELETDPGFLFVEEEVEAEAASVSDAPTPEPVSPQNSEPPTAEQEPEQPHEPVAPQSENDSEEAAGEEAAPQPKAEEKPVSGKRSSKKKSRAARKRAQSSASADESDEEEAETSRNSGDRKEEGSLPLFPRRSNRRPLADRLFHVVSDNPDVDVIEHAMFTLLEGGIVGVPTDTVYGLAVDATNAEAVERLYRLKGRNRQKAMAILVHNTEMLSRLVTRFPEKVDDLIDEFWPGSLTIIFPKPVGALAGVSATRSIGVRIPDHNTVLALISMISRPLATTSANRAGESAATTVEEVVKVFGDSLDCILDAGPAPGMVASTVLSVVEMPYQILREGAVPRERLKGILGDLLAD